MIQYIENTNLAYCDGYKFRKDRKTGYWLCSTLHKRLHVYIYEKYNGPIPKGYEVHHIDHNKDNNEIENLILLTRKQHNELHKKEMTEELKQKLRDNLNKNARPKANEWHKSEKGKEWHKKHYEDMKEKLYKKYNFKCLQCGVEFESTVITSKFCSNACKSKNRRLSKKDVTKVNCIVCGKEYETNKYRVRETCSKKCFNLLKKGN